MKQLDEFKGWYHSLQPRERALVIATAIILVVTLFYISVWEPLHNGLAEEQEKYHTQLNNILWMQKAATEIRTLKTSGTSTTRVNNNLPVSLAIEQSLNTAGLKNNLDKLESSGKNDAKVKLDAASFDQMLIWLNTLEQRFGISITSASIERTDKPGIINARLSFEKSNG